MIFKKEVEEFLFSFYLGRQLYIIFVCSGFRYMNSWSRKICNIREGDKLIPTVDVDSSTRFKMKDKSKFAIKEIGL